MNKFPFYVLFFFLLHAYQISLYSIEKVDLDNILDQADSLFHVSSPEGKYMLIELLKNKDVRDEHILAKAHYMLGMHYLDISNPDSAHYQLNKSLEKISHKSQEMVLANANTGLGIIHKLWAEYDSALVNYNIALKIFQKHNYYKGVANTYNNIGNIYKINQDYLKAIDFYSKSLALEKEFHFEDGQAGSYTNLSNVYYRMGKTDIALEFLKQALEIKKKLNKPLSVASILSNMAVMIKKQGDIDKSLQLNKEALNIRRKNNAKKGIAISLNNIANIYRVKGELEQALEYAMKAKKIKKTLDNKKGYVATLHSIGAIYYDKDKKESALKYFTLGADIARKHNINEMLTKILKDISDLYSEQKDYKKAYAYLHEYNALQDSLHKHVSASAATDIKASTLLMLKNQELETLRKENENISAISTKESILLYILAFLMVIILSLMFILYRYYANKRKINLLLKKRNQQYHQIIVKLKSANNEKDKFLSILAHDMINPFHAFIGLSQFLAKSFNDLTRDEIKESIDDIYDSAKNLYYLLENLLKWGRTKDGKIPFNPDVVALDMLANNNLALLKNNAKNKNITLISDVKNSFKIFADANIVTTIIRNLTSNAIKFTPCGGTVIISAEINNDVVEISVEDNGLGIRDEDKEKIFNVAEHYTTFGTSNEKGTGLGLILCHNLVEKHEGSIWFESQKDKGSKFTFSIPYRSIDEIENLIKG